MRAILRKHALRAGLWTFGGHAAGQLLRLAGNILLTRLLMPEMFGVMTLAVVVMVGVNMFSDIGLRQVVVRSQYSDETNFLNTVWTMQILRGLLVALVLLAVGGVVASLANTGLLPSNSTYANPALPWVLVGLAFTVLLQGAESTKILLAQRDLQVHRITAIELMAQVISLVTMLLWAWCSPSVFALVAGAIAAGFWRIWATHWLLPGPRNFVCWHRPAVAEVMSLGSWVFLTSILGFLVTSGDRLLFGWLLTAEQMGYYALATLLVLAVHEIVNKLIANVAFPALSGIYRERPDDLVSSFYKVRLPVDAICLVTAGFLYMASDSIVAILYDHRYEQAGQYLSLFSLTLLSLRYSVVTQVFFVIGKPQIMFIIQFVRLVTLVFGVIGGFHFLGLDGALWGVVLSFWSGMLLSLMIFMPRYRLLNWIKEMWMTAFGVLGAFLGWVANGLYKVWL